MWIGIIVGALALIVGIVVLMAKKKKRSKFTGANVYRDLMGGGGGGGDGSPPASEDPRLQPLRQNLRVKYLYQEDKIDAAIAIEREKNPSGNQEGWMKAAIERWERDNR